MSKSSGHFITCCLLSSTRSFSLSNSPSQGVKTVPRASDDSKDRMMKAHGGLSLRRWAPAWVRMCSQAVSQVQSRPEWLEKLDEALDKEIEAGREGEGEGEGRRFQVINKQNIFKKVGSLANREQVMVKRSHPELPEICVAGRSNAGKSSLVNHLLNAKYLARASSTPGKTKNIDLYMVNKQFIFADMPGYDFGRDFGMLHKQWQKEWKPLIYTYLQRSPVKAALFVADIRWKPTEEDVAITTALRDCGVPTLLVMTKDDKILDKADPEAFDESFQINPVRDRPHPLTSESEARSWLAARVRGRLLWPDNLPHLHYSINKPKPRKHLRRWIASLCQAADRAEAQKLIESAWSHYPKEQPLVDKLLDRKMRNDGRVHRALERERIEKEKKMAEKGERPVYGGGGMKPVSSF